jgi:signal transduction histidine kinase/HAMP domain-containing protein
MDINKKAIHRITHKYFSLQAKLGLSFSILTIVTSAMLTLTLYQAVRGRLREDIRQRLYDIVNVSALQVDGDKHATLVDPDQEGSTTYMHIKSILQKIRDKGTDIRYVYTWRRNTKGQLIFVVDAETDPKKISHLGDVYTSSEPSILAELATLDHTAVDEKFNTDEWGIWLSGYAPFYRSDGRMEGILGMDIAASNVILHERHFLWIALGVFTATIPLALILGWLIGRKLAAPIARLKVGSERIAEGDLNHRVVIQSNDEVGSLAIAFNNMTQNLQNVIIAREQEIAARRQAEHVIQQNSEAQAVLNKLLSISLESLELKETLDRSLKLIITVPWLQLESKGCIFLVEDDTNNLVMTVQYKLPEILSNLCQKVPFGKCICGQAASNRIIQFVNCVDEHHDVRYDGVRPHGHYCVPIISTGKVIGVVCLYITEGYVNSRENEDFLMVVANTLAGIILRKKSEESLENANSELEATVEKLTAANHELEEFAYIAAHDLKSPVRAIGSLAGMISNDCRDILNEQSKQQLDMLVQRTERMNEFINGILKYVTLKYVTVQKEKVDIHDVVNWVIAQMGTSKETVEITVENELPVVMCQRIHLTQIFHNLLDNAVKYMDKPKGRIKIGCVEKDNYWEFSVADNGSGIEEKYFDKIFQIFQRLTSRDEIEGTGIGLSLVRKIVELYSGKVWVKSIIGEGSTFFFTLPKQEIGVKNEKLYANIIN